jgi:hypothetical protein
MVLANPKYYVKGSSVKDKERGSFTQNVHIAMLCKRFERPGQEERFVHYRTLPYSPRNPIFINILLLLLSLFVCRFGLDRTRTPYTVYDCVYVDSFLREIPYIHRVGQDHIYRVYIWH